MKSITILMLHLQHGGIEKQTITLANELARTMQVKIVSTYDMGRAPAYPLSDKVAVEYLIAGGPNRAAFAEAVRRKNPFSILREGLSAVRILIQKRCRMKKAIRALRCDLVLSTRIEYAEMLVRARPEGVILVTQEHLHDDSPRYVRRVRRSYGRLDRLVVLSAGSQAYYASWLGDEAPPIHVIPNLLSGIPEESAPLQGRHLVAVGRLHPVKGFDRLLRVFALVVKDMPEARLSLLGDGNERGPLQEKARRLGIEDKVTFCGMLSQEEVSKALLDADLMVMTSHSECFPMVLLEAQSLGLPAVAFDVPVGPKRILTEGENGHLIPDGDEKAMAEKILSLLNDRERLHAFGRSAKKKSYDYTPERIVPLWEALFGE